MFMKKRWAALTLSLTPAIAGAFVGCPSLNEIGVGRRDDGAVAESDRQADRSLVDAGAEADPCTASPAEDPKNCGRCGHDCLGGGCKGGVCQPYAIVTGIEGPFGVAVRNGVVYFTSTFLTVARCTVDDCAHTLSQLASNQGIPRGLTVDDTNVYWANAGFPFDGGVFDGGGYAGSIATCGLEGCAGGNPVVLAPTEGRPVDLAVNASALFWTDDYNGLVRSCSVGGCGQNPTTLATDHSTLSGVAIDLTSIYWAEAVLGNIIKCPLTGCGSFTPFASGQVGPAKVDVTNDTVFWSASGAIMSCPTSGCGGAPRVFAKGQSSPYAIAHDATNLYWTLFEHDGQVESCPLSGCTAPTVLADMQDLPSSVAVDDTSVYWANSGGSTVMRVMK
jgi:hypothetical protein